MTERPFISFHRPSIDEAEIQAVAETLRSGWLTTGPRTAQFEQEFRDYVQAPQALAVNSCTAGLHLALAALGVGPGDEVITSPLTFCATVNCIHHVGATPVLADIDAAGNLDPGSVADRITDRTRAVIPVHFAGLPCEMNTIWTLARQRGIHVVEDAAHAVGAHYRGNPIGAGNPANGDSSAAVAFSFYATKNLTTGEGGMITCHSAELADRMKVLCLHGISKDAWNRYSDKGNWYYEVVENGFKYNLSDIQSTIGIQQLRKQEQFLERRKKYADYYSSVLGSVDEVEIPREWDYCRHAWHLYVVRLELAALSISRGEFIEHLRQRGIGASVHFIPIYEHPCFADLALDIEKHCPTAVGMCPRLISLPLYPALTLEQVHYIASTVKEVAREYRRTRLFAAAG